MRPARIATKFLLIYVIAFVGVYLMPEFIHRRDFAQAFWAWYRNPTEEKEATLQKEQ